jgi:peptidoglycan/xylan/chitin deacetylase (PgdA/CDA1 family)
MSIAGFLKDKRNPIYFLDLLKSKSFNLDVKQIYFTFTVDLEKYKGNLDRRQFDKLLNLLNEYGKGTIFVETSLLDKEDLSLDSHEVGSHGYGHLALGDDWWIKNEEKTKNRLNNIKKSTELIKDKLKVNPISFRCPKFSKGNDVNKILADLGYKIDSSNNPHNGRNLPTLKKEIMEIPISRSYKPSLAFKYGLPHLKYDSMMFSNLKKNGLNDFTLLSRKIVQTWPREKTPLLNFMCHNWDFNSQKDFDLVRDYVGNLQNVFKVKFLPLFRYYEIVKEE